MTTATNSLAQDNSPAQDQQAVREVYAAFLMIGQSNMAGRGHFHEVEPRPTRAAAISQRALGHRYFEAFRSLA